MPREINSTETNQIGAMGQSAGNQKHPMTYLGGKANTQKNMS